MEARVSRPPEAGRPRSPRCLDETSLLDSRNGLLDAPSAQLILCTVRGPAALFL
jgi:hypothetical protein